MNPTFRATRFAVILAAMATTLPAWSLNPGEIAKIEQAAPRQATVKPAKERRVLVFSQALKYKHSSIPHAEKAFEVMGKSTGAFTVDVTSDPADLSAENLEKYDALVLNNNTGEWLTTPTLRQGFLDFVRNGKGIVGIHAATDGNFEWAEFGEMLGGYFKNHPWLATDTVTLKIDDPDHPVAQAFGGKPFVITEELYQIVDPYSRETVRELVSLDTEKTDMNKEGIVRTDGDFPVSWVKTYGKGRVFYTSLGHNEALYSNPVVLQHYLDGLQYALGDLEADATPTATLANAADKATSAATASSGQADKPTTGTAATEPVSDEDLQAAINKLDTYDYGEDRTFLLTIDAAMRTSHENKAQRQKLLEGLLSKAVDDKLTYAARDLALRRIGEIGKADAVARVAPLIGSKDEKLAASAIRTITDISGDAATKALLSAMKDAKGDTRVALINALGERRTQAADAVSELTKIARQGDTAQVIAAVTALGKIGTTQAGKTLLNDVRPPDAAREAWFAAMTTAGDAVAEKDPKLARDLYDRVLQMGAQSPARLAAFKGKALLDPNPEAVALQALEDNVEPALEEVARQILVRGDNADVSAQLLDRLKNATPEKKVAVVEILGARGEKSALEDITALAAAPSPEHPQLQLAALAALQHIGNEQTLPTLLKVAAEQKGKPAETAIASIVEMRVMEVDAELLNLITGAPSPAEQVVAIEAAVARKAENLTDPLLKAAAAKDASVAVVAFKALAEAAKEENIPTLLEIHDDLRQGRVIREAGRTIAAVARAASKKADAVKAVQAALEKATEENVKASLISVLGRIGGTMALETLTGFAKSDDEKLKDAAIRALAEFPDADALDQLMEIASGDASQVHKVLALRGIARLLSQNATKPGERLAMAEKAIAIAPGAEEKKAILGGVAELKTTGVLEFLLPHLDQADLKDETAAAILMQAPIANQINPGHTTELLNPLRDKLTSDQWNKLEEVLTPGPIPSGAIRAYEISQVYKPDNDGDVTAAMKQAFPPETSEEGWVGLLWADHDESGDRIARAHLHNIYPNQSNAAVYLRVHVWSPEERQVQLRTGSDDGMKAWLNGNEIFESASRRGFRWDDESNRIQLKRGWNTILLKVVQADKTWSMRARLLDEKGKPMEDLRYSAFSQE